MSERSLQEALLLDDRLAQRGHIGQRKLLRWFCPPRVADFRLLPSVERSGERNAESRIAFGVADRSAHNHRRRGIYLCELVTAAGPGEVAWIPTPW
ncbi:MAG: hypothetical protein ACYC3I_26890 [Gemmataceae bacterium]